MKVRAACFEDVGAITQLDKEANTHPWGEKLIKEALVSRHNWVIEGSENGQLLAWLTASRILDESELELIVVAPSARRQGYAHKLMLHWLSEMMTASVSHFILEVRESNQAAISLYLQMGFVQVGLRKHYYSSPAEHALLMSRLPEDHIDV
ncbi:ribosomal protein S18-alanine N-acetyltransferase [Marinomonas sp. 15G1-11]|uniref:[Ribosomal protein bS18]-alanine N-acetyltransferase n=1 Tax=Marinomonas phaeophyticola TaxID=3004091 RepID=A0ABT4JZ79_9GAMM|nr:ribosomal protein S18-alanine N-acetyltransferase [Marinomonas sp. 15G1-11]MCZ2723540.1 ribosomal protein S18-alanine N-acetyltransferase [Marinomonas sp. 15G1-11]